MSFAGQTQPELEDSVNLDANWWLLNMDTANLVMVVADDPVRAVHTLKDRIVHTHAKDGVQLAPCDPVAVYAAFAEGGIELVEATKKFREERLGEGGVDWDAYLDALETIGYKGYLTIEREAGDDRVADIAHGIRFLREKISES